MPLPDSQAKIIVNKVIERLQTISSIIPLGETELKAFKNPFRPLTEEEVPCLKVGLMRGTAREINNAIEYEHSDTLIVGYVDHGNDDGELEDRLYDVGEIIYRFLINDENDSSNETGLNSVVNGMEFSQWDVDLKEASPGVGAIVLKFNVVYHSRHEIEFSDLAGFEVTIKPEGAGEETEPYSVETVNLPSE